jgi:ribosomal protein S18 acetylase RimI-like enzyme
VVTPSDRYVTGDGRHNGGVSTPEGVLEPVHARLVRLGPDDAGEILTLQRASYVSEAQIHDDAHLPQLRQSLAELIAELAHPNVTALGLRIGHRLVAAVRLRDLYDGQIDLGRLVVAPDQQGRGLGTRLLRAGERAIPGTRRIHLFTAERSAANLRLYRRLGYVESHRSSADGHVLVHLTREVSEGPPELEPRTVVAAGPPVPGVVARLLAALPEWFGHEQANRAYVDAARRLPTLLARVAGGQAAAEPGVAGDGAIVGVLLLDRHLGTTAEIHLIAVDPGWHRRGVGRALVEAAAEFAGADGARLLEVKTPGPSRPDAAYERTRAFYLALGFEPVEELAGLWPGIPCLLLVRPL